MLQVKLFDFGGMDKRHLPFREIEPEEGNVVVSISYSGTGHAFLVCTAGSQPKVIAFLPQPSMGVPDSAQLVLIF